MSWHHQSGIGRNNFDFIRFALALAVVFAHSYALLQGGDAGEPLMRATHQQLTFGALAVDWFFVISGFLITHSWLRKPAPKDFLKKRALRIYPGFLGSILFCTFIVVPLASPVAREHFIATIRPVPLIGNLFLVRYFDPGIFRNNPGAAVNGSLWSISYEFWCYIGVMLLGLTALIKREWFILSAFFATIAISILFEIRNLRPGGGPLFPILFGAPRLWARLLPYYLAGMSFYLVRLKIPHSRWIGVVCLLLLVVAAVIPIWGVSLLLPLAGTYVLFCLAFDPKIRLENWARFGDFSYGMYVFAFPIQQWLVQRLGTGTSPFTLFFISAPLTIAAGIISWHLIERHFLKLKKKPIEALPEAIVAEFSGKTA